MKEVLELPEGRVVVQDHGGFLFVVEQGRIRSLPELRYYLQWLERLAARDGAKRVVIDARAQSAEPPADVQTAMWDWLCATGRGFEMVAFVLPTEMGMARVNMMALARGLDVRAFSDVFAAQRWLFKGKRRSSSFSIQTVSQKLPSSRPPPPPRARPDGTYRATPGSEEHISNVRISAVERPPADQAGERPVRSSDLRSRQPRARDDGDPRGGKGSRGVA